MMNPFLKFGVEAWKC